MQQLTSKETNLLNDAKSHEELCVEKYNKYSAQALAPELKGLFQNLSQKEQQHVNSINQILSGTIPSISGHQAGQQPPAAPVVNQNSQDKEADKFLCQDALTTEKQVSGYYNTAIFEFNDTGIRNVLNHIQKEEQEHGDQIYKYMSANGMYCQ